MTHKEDVKRIKETINNRKVIKWFNYFADYIETSKPNIYNEACNFADDTENNKS